VATHWFDTHPSDAGRVRAAAAAATSGILVGGDEPATQLLCNFDALSTAATRHHYEHDLGLGLGLLTLVATDDVFRESRNREERERAVEQFFGKCVSAYRPVRITADHGPLSASELLASAEARASMAAADERLSEQYRRFR